MVVRGVQELHSFGQHRHLGDSVLTDIQLVQILCCGERMGVDHVYVVEGNVDVFKCKVSDEGHWINSVDDVSTHVETS